MGGVGGRLIGFMLERLYRELAWAYDAVSWLVSLGHWRSWTQAALPFVRGERVLEVGCGPGHLLPFLAEGGRRVSACDLSGAMLCRTRRQVAKAGLPVSLCRARAQALPFAAAGFDAVVCTFPSRFIADPRTWAEFERVLAPGGRAVVVYGAVPGGSGVLERISRRLFSLGESPCGVDGLAARVGQGRLDVHPAIVEQGDDRVGLLIGERDGATDTG